MSASRFAALVLLTFAAWAVRPGAATAQDLDPSLWVTNGTVYATASFGDTIYAAGAFTEVGKATGGAAAFEPTNGSILSSFPSVLGSVHAVVSDGAGGCYIGGQFTHVGGLPRSNLAHIASDNTVTSWDPSPNNEVYALARSATGSIYVGSKTTSQGQQQRHPASGVRLDVLGQVGSATQHEVVGLEDADALPFVVRHPGCFRGVDDEPAGADGCKP